MDSASPSQAASNPAREPSWFSRHPPPGPFRRGFWRSPLRGPWFTAVLSLGLLIGIPIVFLTGLLSYAAYNPNLGGPFNDLTPDKGLLGFWLFRWPTEPSWLYWLNQGIHVTLGLMLIPVVLAKLWSVLPKLFEWPPARSVVQFVERLSLVLLVGGAMFQLVTGVMNIQYFYIWPFSFYQAHFYGAWVFMSAFVVHIAFRMSRLVTALRSRSLREELRTPTARTTAEEPDPDHLVSPNPAPATISRRGALGMVSAGSVSMLALSVGQTVAGDARSTALLAPRGQDVGEGPGMFQINKTAEAANVTRVDQSWRLTLVGPSGNQVLLSRAQLLSLPQHTARLSIACVEGWSTGLQNWAGVRLADLAELAGASAAERLFVESLQTSGPFTSVTLAQNQIHDLDALLALRVNGVDLPLDHGYPARVVVPAMPGVHNTKWVTRLTYSFESPEP